MKSYAGAVLACLLLIMFSLAGCGGEETADSEQATREPEPTTQPSPTAEEPTPDLEGALDDDAPVQPSLDSGVFATGYIESAQDADLVFQVNGQVDEVLVEEGDYVTRGQVLAVLDTRSFDQAVRDAEAALISARADQLSLVEDPVPEDVRAAEASIAQAMGQLNQVQGSVTPQDVAAAQARLEESRASLADLEDGADPIDIQQARVQVDQAQANLDSTRSRLSHAKTQAQIGIDQAADQVRQAQTDYSAAYWDWQYVRDHGKEPPMTEGRAGPTLSGHGEQAYRDRLTQAELQLQTAQEQLEAAQKSYEEAFEAEITGVQQAEEQVQIAQLNLEQLLEPPDLDDLAQAQARVADAEAQLAKLQGEQRAGQLAAAQASVAAAQANLERLYSEPTESQSVRAEASIARAEANLEQARLNREYAQIQAPFSGEVVTINVDPGDPAITSSAGGTPAIRLIDLSELRVEVEVTDADIARVRKGQQAEIVADALPNRVFMGKVTFVSPASTTNRQGVTEYLVRIDLDDEEELPLRVGMSVSVNIETR